jgi:uncharacterized protein
MTDGAAARLSLAPRFEAARLRSTRALPCRAEIRTRVLTGVGMTRTTLRRGLGHGVVAMSLALLFAVSAHAQDTTSTTIAEIPPAVGFVNDRANLLDESTRAKLEAFLDQVKRKTAVEFAVLTVPTTAPESPEEFKVRVFEKWGLGGAHDDNGLLLLVAMKERQAIFETGYGVEGTLPDGVQARLLRETLRPRFQQNDHAGGITAAVLAAAQRIAKEKGVTLEWNGRELRYSGSRSSRRLPGWVILFLVAFVLLSLGGGLGGGGMGRRRRRGMWMYGPGWGGGFGGWGGGFGGGFGGGGGGSFGGFGGGHSGGGGGGTSW